MCFSWEHTFPCLAQAPTGSLFLSSWTRCMRPRHTNEVLDQTRQCQNIWSHSSLCHSPSWKWSCLVLFGQNRDFWSNVWSSWEGLAAGCTHLCSGGSFAGSSVAELHYSPTKCSLLWWLRQAPAHEWTAMELAALRTLTWILTLGLYGLLHAWSQLLVHSRFGNRCTGANTKLQTGGWLLLFSVILCRPWHLARIEAQIGRDFPPSPFT